MTARAATSSWSRLRAWLQRRTAGRHAAIGGRASEGARRHGGSTARSPRAAESTHPRPDLLATVGAACEAGERLEFDFAARDGSRTSRDVEPYRLVRSGAFWYLLGYDLGRDDWRTFRLDRILAPVSRGAAFIPRDIPTGDDAPYLAGPAPGADDLAPSRVPMPPEPAVVAATSRWARDMLAPGAAVVLDTETTDLPGAICEIAVVDAATGETLLDTLVDPGAAMSPRAQAVHGIADADVAGAPTWAEVLPRLLAVTAGRQVLAYNVEFDAGVIRADTARYHLGLGPLEEPNRWDCVMVRRAQTLPDGSPLALGAGHRARGDALAARAVLQEMAALSPAA